MFLFLITSFKCILKQIFKDNPLFVVPHSFDANLVLEITNCRVFSSADLNIPKPPTEVIPSHGPPPGTSSLATTGTTTGSGSTAQPGVKKMKKGKPMLASPTLLTPRCVSSLFLLFPSHSLLSNLFATDYLKANPDTSASEFKLVYDNLDPDSKKV